jgi:hypothetical protein
MTARVFACGSIFGLVVWLGTARAQSLPEVRLDGGVAQIRQAGRDARNGGLFSALGRWGDERLAALASGAFTYAGDSASAIQAIGAVAWRPAIDNPLQTEGGVAGAAFGLYPLGRGGNTSAYLRERAAFRRGGFWLGGEAGHTSRDGIDSHSTAFDVGGSVRAGDFEAAFSWSRVRSDDRKLLEAAGIFLQRDAAAHDLDDKSIALHYERGRVKFDLSQSWRAGERATLANQSAFLASAELVLVPRVSLAVTGGRELADPVHGIPDAQVVSIALRVVVFPWHDLEGQEVASEASAVVRPTADGALLVVRVRDRLAQRVEVAGSFSGWQPVALERTGDGWQASIPLSSGRHRVAVRIDGGPWRAPANLGKIKDEFGGASGIIVVP